MYDPNAISGTYLHWLVTNIKGNDFDSGEERLTYYGPHPPKNSGVHNYIFSLFLGGTQFKGTPFKENRTMSLDELFHKLNITNIVPIYTNKFQSQYIEGGRRTKTVKKIKMKRKRSRKNKRIYRTK